MLSLNTKAALTGYLHSVLIILTNSTKQAYLVEGACRNGREGRKSQGGKDRDKIVAISQHRTMMCYSSTLLFSCCCLVVVFLLLLNVCVSSLFLFTTGVLGQVSEATTTMFKRGTRRQIMIHYKRVSKYAECFLHI